MSGITAAASVLITLALIFYSLGGMGRACLQVSEGLALGGILDRVLLRYIRNPCHGDDPARIRLGQFPYHHGPDRPLAYAGARDLGDSCRSQGE